MPVTFTAPVVQPSMASARIVALSLDVEGQTADVVYQPLDGSAPPIEIGITKHLHLTFAQLGVTKAGVYGAVLAAVGLTGTIT